VLDRKESHPLLLLDSYEGQSQKKGQMGNRDQGWIDSDYEKPSYMHLDQERISLMKHMETLYHHAVQTQSASRREQQTLKLSIAEASRFCARDRAEVVQLDERITELKGRRVISEEAFRLGLGLVLVLGIK
jgi:hypothetical protein